VAEILLKSVPSGAVKDGDIIAAINDRSILLTHATRICKQNAARMRNGNLATGTLLHKFYEHTSEYRFERISKDEVRRVDIKTLDEVVFSKTPKLIDYLEQRIDVEIYLRHAKTANNLFIFGNEGSEIWYGGTKDYSLETLDKLWGGIETGSGLLKSDHQKWEYTPHEKRGFFAFSVDDFDDETAAEYIAVKPKTTERKYRLNYEIVISGKSIDHVRDPTLEKDTRKTVLNRADIITEKM
jgi:hypothetical protein